MMFLLTHIFFCYFLEAYFSREHIHLYDLAEFKATLYKKKRLLFIYY